MKFAAGLMTVVMAGVGVAHEGHEHAPVGKALTVAVRTGNGTHAYETVPGWGVLPEGKQIGPTHGGVAVDKAGLVYVSTDAEHGICVFKPDGTLVRSMPLDCGGLHSLHIIEDDGAEYLVGAATRTQKVVKIGLGGKIVMTIPNEATGEIPQGLKGVTAVAAGPDGSLFVACGYGSNLLHMFDASGKLVKTVGGRGKEDGKFMTCHGVTVDTRPQDGPLLLVADRENRRLVHMTLDLDFVGVHATNLRRPCAISIHGDHAAVAELEARVTIVNGKGVPVAFLGDNPNRKHWANFRVAASDMSEGIFTAPHGLSYDGEGNLYVQDWNATGRVTKLSLLSEQ
jgi:glucose/arabinose dehydrogenase